MEPEVHYHIHKSSPFKLNPEPVHSTLRMFVYYSPICSSVFQVVSSLHVYQLKSDLMHSTCSS